MLEVDCAIVAGDWPTAAPWDELARRAVAAALGGAGHDALLTDDACRIEVAVRLSDDAEITQLNSHYRHKPQPTNILSFPMFDETEITGALQSGAEELLLGDLVLAAETVRREADAQGLTLADHVTHLLVHGTLHLLGHDHQDDPTAEAMEGLETAILAGLGIADPYAGRQDVALS